jgi:hypothetical protein
MIHGENSGIVFTAEEPIPQIYQQLNKEEDLWILKGLSPGGREFLFYLLLLAYSWVVK